MNAVPTPEPVDLQEALTSYTRAIGMMARHAILRIVLHTRPGTAITAALVTIPALCHETQHLRTLLARARLDYANLIAAAHATLNADHEGEPDPLWYLRDELAAHGQLPGNRWGRA